MEYKYTDTDKTVVVMALTLAEVAMLREVLEAAHKAELAMENVSRWRIRDMVRKLAETQGKAAETLAYEAKALADKAKLADDF